MTTDPKKFASVGAILAVLTATPALAQEPDEWDANQDRAVDQVEFGLGLGETNAFGDWDEDMSAGIDEDEYEGGVTTAFDVDGSGDLDEEEQAAYEESQWGEAEFSEWDADESGDVDEEEFNAGVFGTYDDDESGDLNEEEYATYQEEDEGWFDW